jgi:peptide/nickel transport system substrate-binding protein
MRCLTALALTVLLVLAGCGGSSSSSSGGTHGGGTPKLGGSVTVALDSDANSLDPAMDTSLAAAEISAQIFDSLVTVSKSGAIQPSLASSWTETTPTTYIFHLRKGVTFQDGTAFNAAAVKFSIDRERNPKGASPWIGSFSPVTNVAALNSGTVEFTLSKPYSPLLNVLAGQAGMIVSPAAVKKYGNQFGNHPVGTGPFTFVSWVHNDHVSLKRNPHYWQQGKPYLNTVTFKPVADPTTKSTDLISGAAQMVDYVPPQLISRVKSTPGLVYKSEPGSYADVTWIGLNPADPTLKSESVRQAFAMAIDRQSIVKNVVFGAGTAAQSLLSPASWAWSTEVPPIPYDPQKAKQLLGGKQISLLMKVPPTYVQQAQVVQSNLAQAGIHVKIQEEDWGTLINDFYKGNYQVEFQDLLGTPLYDPDMVLGGFYDPTGAFNGIGFNDPSVVEMLDRGRQLSSQSQRKPVYIQLQKDLQKVDVYIPIYYPDNERAWSSSLGGVTLWHDGLVHLTDVWMR